MQQPKQDEFIPRKAQKKDEDDAPKDDNEKERQNININQNIFVTQPLLLVPTTSAPATSNSREKPTAVLPQVS